jgi:hypothetical protein
VGAVEEVVVGAQLEPEVHDVEDEQDDGGAAGEEDGAGLVILGASVEDVVKLEARKSLVRGKKPQVGGFLWENEGW